jgi:hypothetical protein
LSGSEPEPHHRTILEPHELDRLGFDSVHPIVAANLITFTGEHHAAWTTENRRALFRAIDDIGCDAG